MLSPTYQHIELHHILPIKQLKYKLFVDEFVSQYTAVPVSLICTRLRSTHVVRARHMAWYLLKSAFGFNITLIGKCYDRDHTTVMDGVRKVEEHYGTEFLKELEKKAIFTYPHP